MKPWWDGERGMDRDDRVVDFACGVRLRHGRTSHLEYVNNLAARSEKFRTRRLHQKNRCVRRWKEKHEDAAFVVLPTKLKKKQKDMTELLGHVMRAVAGTVSETPTRACCTRQDSYSCLDWRWKCCWDMGSPVSFSVNACHQCFG